MGKRAAPAAPPAAPKASKRQAPSAEDSKTAAKRGGSATGAGAAPEGCDRTAAGRLKLVVDWMKREGFQWDESALQFETEPEVCTLPPTLPVGANHRF